MLRKGFRVRRVKRLQQPTTTLKNLPPASSINDHSNATALPNPLHYHYLNHTPPPPQMMAYALPHFQVPYGGYSPPNHFLHPYHQSPTQATQHHDPSPSSHTLAEKNINTTSNDKQTHKKEEHSSDDSSQHRNSHNHDKTIPPLPPPPPTPGPIKRIFDYILSALKKRPFVSTMIFANAAYHIHASLNPEAHNKMINDTVSTLQTRFAMLDRTRSGSNGSDVIKITKLNDSLMNYSSSFRKASSSSSITKAFEEIYSKSVLNHMKGLENNLSEEKKKEFIELTKKFHQINSNLTTQLSNLTMMLRQFQLMELSVTSNISNQQKADTVKHTDTHTGTGNDSTTAISTIIDMSVRSKEALQQKLFHTVQAKYSLETQYVQAVCALLSETQRRSLCDSLLKNNSSSFADMSKSPNLYPEISGFSSTKRSVFVLKFDGDLSASAVSRMRHEITAIVENADKARGDRVVVVLNSGGGTVGGYGLGASQLERIKAAGLHLTVCVDEVAASGGYLMACVADNLVSAPFATIGSIGVMTMIPNIYERLQREGIHVDTVTAGKYKRTLTPLSKATPENRKKLQEDLESVHKTFKEHIVKYRPEVDIEKVSTGETWLGSEALVLGLCDQISTSDDYILQLSKLEGTEVYHVKYSPAAKRRSVLQNMIQPPSDDEDASNVISFYDESTSFIATFLSQIISKTSNQVLQENGSSHIGAFEKNNFK